jgi:hypothetical protein
MMEGMPVKNKCKTTPPLRVLLADEQQVLFTHEWDIHIDGLPTVLMGHTIPDHSITSLFRIRVLKVAGCEVFFDCGVIYNGRVILVGSKDPDTNLFPSH